MSDRLSRKQIARSTIHQNNIPISEVINGVTYVENFCWNRERHGEGGFNNDSSLHNFEILSGDIETQPNFDEEDDRQFWGDNELDSSISDVDLCERTSDKNSKAKHRKKLKRTFNSVISKPRILKRKAEKLDVASGSNFSEEDTHIKVPDWNFSNLPVARKYRESSDSSSDSNDDIRVVRKEDWKRRREEKRQKSSISYSSEASDSDTEDLCVHCYSYPQDTILVHDSTGHLCCCFDCAKELHSHGGLCPVCGLTITRIINI